MHPHLPRKDQTDGFQQAQSAHTSPGIDSFPSFLSFLSLSSPGVYPFVFCSSHQASSFRSSLSQSRTESCLCVRIFVSPFPETTLTTARHFRKCSFSFGEPLARKILPSRRNVLNTTSTPPRSFNSPRKQRPQGQGLKTREFNGLSQKFLSSEFFLWSGVLYSADLKTSAASDW